MHRISDYRGKFGVIICSSTRNASTDDSGAKILAILKESGHEISHYEVIKDDKKAIQRNVSEFVEDSDCVIISGGTGITHNDVTVEAVRDISEYELTSFNPIFAMLSFEKIGASAILSRATAFIVNRIPVFCLPGSPAGAELGVREIILKQIDHLHHELSR